MADKNLQFLDIPRAEPAKTAVETRVGNFREIYAPYDAGRRRPAGRPLPGLRQSVLRVEMPGPQLHSQLAEAHRGGQPVRGGGAVAQDQLAAGGLRAHLSAGSAVRGRLHAERRPGRRHHRLDREVHHRRGAQAGWKPDMSQRAAHRQARGGHRRGTGGSRLRRHPGAQRRAAGGVRPSRRASADCSPSAFRPSSSRRKSSRSAARSCRGWVSSSGSASRSGPISPSRRCSASTTRCFSAWAPTPRCAAASRARICRACTRRCPTSFPTSGTSSRCPAARARSSACAASASWCSAAAIPPWTATAPPSARAPSR